MTQEEKEKKRKLDSAKTKKISALLKKRSNKLGFTNYSLHLKTGIAQRQQMQILNGEKGLTVTSLVALLDALGVDLPDLLSKNLCND